MTTWTYDNANQPSTVTFPNSKVVTYTYDNAGNRATMVDPDSGTSTYTYYGNNQLNTLTNPNSEVTTWTYTKRFRVGTWPRLVQEEGVGAVQAVATVLVCIGTARPADAPVRVVGGPAVEDEAVVNDHSYPLAMTTPDHFP